MSLTEEEIKYYNDGINAVFKKDTAKKTARKYIDPSLTNCEILEKLNIFGKKDFVATVTALGTIDTPLSIKSCSKSDIAQMQMFVGYTPPPPPSASISSEETIPQPNMMETIKILQNQITILYEIIERKSSELSAIYDILNISNSTNILSDDFVELVIVGEKKIVTACVLDENKNKQLGRKITQGDASVLGILKSHFECTNWANSIEDHYFTITQDPKDCSSFLPPCLVYTQCMEAIGVSIEVLIKD